MCPFLFDKICQFYKFSEGFERLLIYLYFTSVVYLSKVIYALWLPRVKMFIFKKIVTIFPFREKHTLFSGHLRETFKEICIIISMF